MKNLSLIPIFVIIFFSFSIKTSFAAATCGTDGPGVCEGRYDGGCNCASGTRITCCTNVKQCYQCTGGGGTVGGIGNTNFVKLCSNDSNIISQDIPTLWYPVCKDLGNNCYDAHSVPCSCCTPTCDNGNCEVPTCPSGSQELANGCSVASVESCSYSNSCNTGSCSGGSRTCYYSETNLSFVQGNGSTSGPASISMVVDGRTYSLSTDSLNPTHIKLPAFGSSNVQITTPTFTAPVTSRGANYFYQANNYGSNNEWRTWVSCTGTAGEDSCTTMPNANNTQSFVPTSKTVNQVLKEGATGEISAMYATTDKCTDTYKYSLPTKGYYVVDYLPEPPVPCTPGDPTCTWIPEITTNTTERGCSSLTYSGTEVNNELHINAGVTDTDNINEIQTFTLWFSKDTSIPAGGTISASYTGSIISDLGIMIKKSGSDWTNPSIYATNSNLSWGQISLTDGKGYINVSGTNIIEISGISVTQDTKVTFDYKIKFINTPSNLSGMYNIYGGSLDTHMINGNILDQSYYYKFFNWGVDLVNPTVEEITQQILNPKETYMTWSNNDDASGIGKTVINAYRLGGLSTDPAGVKLFLPSAYTTLLNAITLDPNTQIPSDQEIGLYNDTNAWKFTNNTGEKDLINVGNNESGKIALYITAYDKACNTNGTTDEIDLNPWFSTRGATVYSQGNISSTAKDVAGLPYLDGVFNVKTGMNSSLIDIGTELLSTRNTMISNLLHSNSGAVMATDIEDSNNTKDVWYNRLFKKFGEYKPELTSFVKGASDNSVSDSCIGSECYMQSTEDISIPAGYTCDRPTLFVSEKDIHISPNILSDTGLLSGCIFLAKNNIYIDAGTFKSTGTKVMYDYIEGYMIADNQVIFSVADESQVLRDGVEIFGGVVALGTNPTSGNTGISIQRNLRLYSQINPTVVLTYDNKYSSISTIFFGTEYSLYKQEVGFKTF